MDYLVALHGSPRQYHISVEWDLCKSKASPLNYPSHAAHSETHAKYHAKQIVRDNLKAKTEAGLESLIIHGYLMLGLVKEDKRVTSSIYDKMHSLVLYLLWQRPPSARQMVRLPLTGKQRLS